MFTITVTTAVEALRSFGAIDKPTAALLLPLWAHYRSLTPDERSQVLEAFV